MKAKPFKIGSVTIGGKNLLLILGPCVIESEKSAFRAARKLKEVTRRLGPGAAVVVGATVVDEPSPATVVVVDEPSSAAGSLRQACTGRRYT